MKLIKIFFIALFVNCCIKATAQDSSLLKMLDDSLTLNHQKIFVHGTFKATHIINTQTVEQPGKKVLEFLIMHRFGQLNQGAYNLFGLDFATLRLGLNYGLSDRLSIGIGRSSLDKVADASIKYKLLRQTEDNSMPVSVNIYSSLAYVTLRYPADQSYITGQYRMIYTNEFLIARKISPNLSLQLTPVWMHFNLTPTANDKNDVFALGAGGRIKITKRMSINAEYNYLLPNQVQSVKVYNSISGGIDFETGGHVFQLVFSNSQGMIEPYYLAKTTDSWGKGGIYFGFNISRVFNFKK
jgi:opacity protein-like surface antigen